MTDELEQMSPNQRRTLDKALSALETFAAIWAAEIRLTGMAERIAAVPSEEERAKRIAAMIEQGFIEGAYRHYLDHKDKCDELEASRATADRATALEESAAICQRLAVEALDSYTTEAGRTAAHAALICAMGEIRNLGAGSAGAGRSRDSAELQAVKNAGFKMSNIFFNLAQRPGEPIGADMCAVLDTCRKEWDEAIRALKSQQDAAIETSDPMSLLVRLAALKRYRNKLKSTGEPSGNYATLSVPIALLEDIDAAIESQRSGDGL